MRQNECLYLVYRLFGWSGQRQRAEFRALANSLKSDQGHIAARADTEAHADIHDRKILAHKQKETVK